MEKLRLVLVASSLAAITFPASQALAQTSDNQYSLEEIVVTGRKREESLTEVPVSISVWSESSLADAGILNQQDLFDATPGLSFDTATGDRNSSQPGVRGVQSNEIATTLQKVNSFIDGLPMLGQVGSLTFSGVDQVEIYRGPQSAAFGRSTFAGAINYVTSDAAEEFEGSVSVRTSTLGSNEVGLVLSGPINDKFGYRISYVRDEFTGPDEWTATDGTELGTEETETLNAKLNFELSEAVYGELMFSRVDQEDGAAATWTLDPASCNGGGSAGTYTGMGMATVNLFEGDWDCDTDSTPVTRNHDVIGQFIANYDPADYGDLDQATYLAQTNAAGVTYENLLRGQTVEPFTITERDRIQGEINFETDSGLFTVLGMYVEEFYQRWNDSDYSDSLGVINAMGILGMNTASMSDPTDIEETYVEVRWASPEDSRLRYTLSASHYSYDFLTNVYFNYGALAFGLTFDDDGDPATAEVDVDPNRNLIISNSTSNNGLAFGINYDLTDKTTVSFEGRYQEDENCGSDLVFDLNDCVTLDSFAPRIAITTQITDNSNIYAQISQGTNPGGVNITYANPDYTEALDIASGAIPVPDTYTDENGAVLVPLNAGVVYDGAGGNPSPVVSYNAEDFVYYDEEVLTNFEIGYKGTFFDGRGSFSSALFYMDWEDQIQATNLDWDGDFAGGWNEDEWNDNTGNRTFLNAGDAEFYGVEFAGSLAATDIVNIGLNFSLVDASYTDFCSQNAVPSIYSADALDAAGVEVVGIADGQDYDCGILDGNDIPRQSKFSGAFDITASLPNDVLGMRTSLRADVRHTGSYFQDDVNLIARAAVTTMNLSATMRGEDLSLRFYVNNITDEDEPQTINVSNRYTTDFDNPSAAAATNGAWRINPRRPREAGVSLTYNF